MGILEQEVKKERRNKNIRKAILGVVATAGLLSVIAVAPNVLQVLGMIMGKKGRSRERIENSRKRLVEHGLLEYDRKGLLRLTEKGEVKLRQLELCDYKLTAPKRWDKKWRLLSFDIPEKRKSLREKVRRTLQTIGFERLHKSTWVYPHDCEDLITLLKADFKVGKDVIYIIADKIENDGWLKKQFGLS